jgi:phage shock protein C
MTATTMTEALQQLSQLHADGKLTDEEFTLAKRRIIDASVSATPSVTPTAMPNALQKLNRSLTDRWIGGVCGGLAVATSIPTWAWRILFVLMILLNGLGILMYLLMWIFVPLQQPPSTVLSTPVPAAPTAPSA